MKSRDIWTPQNIVILRTDRIGEVMLSTVAVDILKRNFPQANISFVTSRMSAGLLRGRDDIDEILTVDPFAPRSAWLRDAIRLARRLRERNFDLAVVLNAHRVLHIAVCLAGIAQRWGYRRKWPFFLTRSIEDDRNLAVQHEVEYTRDFFQALGLNVDEQSPRLSVEDGMEAMVRANLEEHGVDFARPVVVVHPCASNPLKFWSSSKYARLIRELNLRSCQPVVIGTKDEYEMISDLIAASGAPAVNAAGMFTLEELAALLKIARLFIGNDSGPMHMAAALGTRVIAIFSKKEPGSHPVRWRPWGNGHVIFHELHGQAPCQLLNFSGYYIAQNEISSADVMKSVDQFLHQERL